MSKVRSDHLFVLIKSMRKAEKRYFKVMNTGESKYIKLFDALDKLKNFNEEKLLGSNDWILGTQFSNLKAHLYKKVLHALKNYAQSNHEDITIRENIDYIQLLYDRCLYGQGMQLLQKVKKGLDSSSNENLELRLEVLKWERNLLPHTLGKNNLQRVRHIVLEADKINEKISKIHQLTSLSIELNALYLKTGYIRDRTDYDRIHAFFVSKLPTLLEEDLSFSEKLLWYEIHMSYYNFLQQLENAYSIALKWVALFSNDPKDANQLEKHLKGLNYLLTIQSRLGYHDDFKQTHKKLRQLFKHPIIGTNENLRIRAAKYGYAHQFNGYFMRGDFTRGVIMFQKIESRLENHLKFLDKHSVLILFYKISCLYFGNSDFRSALKWSNRILNSDHQDIREDVHSFARILNLIIHYELGNGDIIEYYLKSTYRFLLKKDDLHLFQQYILQFIKNLPKINTDADLIKHFSLLREKMIELSQSEYDKRAFVYFDIISWLESKIEKRGIEEIIKEKVFGRERENLF